LNFSMLEIGFLSFFIGLLLGFIAGLIVIKIIINKKVKTIYSALNNLLLIKLKHQNELKKRSEALHILNGKFKNLKNEISKFNNNDYSDYISDLNDILTKKGISQIKTKKKD